MFLELALQPTPPILWSNLHPPFLMARKIHVATQPPMHYFGRAAWGQERIAGTAHVLGAVPQRVPHGGFA
jgi:hypothetical protein